jgi:hypothetical protein
MTLSIYPLLALLGPTQTASTQDKKEEAEIDYSSSIELLFNSYGTGEDFGLNYMFKCKSLEDLIENTWRQDIISTETNEYSISIKVNALKALNHIERATEAQKNPENSKYYYPTYITGFMIRYVEYLLHFGKIFLKEGQTETAQAFFSRALYIVKTINEEDTKEINLTEKSEFSFQGEKQTIHFYLAKETIDAFFRQIKKYANAKSKSIYVYLGETSEEGFIGIRTGLEFEKEKLDSIYADAYKTYADFLLEKQRKTGQISQEVYALLQRAEDFNKAIPNDKKKWEKPQRGYFNYEAATKMALIESELTRAQYQPENAGNLESARDKIDNLICDLFELDLKRGAEAPGWWTESDELANRWWLLGRALQAKAQWYKLTGDKKNYYLLNKFIFSIILNQKIDADLTRIIRNSEFSEVLEVLHKRRTEKEARIKKENGNIDKIKKEVKKLDDQLEELRAKIKKIEESYQYRMRPGEEKLEEPEPEPEKPESEKSWRDKTKEWSDEHIPYNKESKEAIPNFFKWIAENIRKGRLNLSEEEVKEVNKLEQEYEEKYEEKREKESLIREKNILIGRSEADIKEGKKTEKELPTLDLPQIIRILYEKDELYAGGIYAEPLTELRYAELLKSEASRMRKDGETKNVLGETPQNLLIEAEKHFRETASQSKLQLPALVGLMELDFSRENYQEIAVLQARFKQLISDPAALDKRPRLLGNCRGKS